MEKGVLSLSKMQDKLGRCLLDQELNKCILGIFIAIHVALACMSAGILNTMEVIAFLYTLTLLMMIQAIDGGITKAIKRKGINTLKRRMKMKIINTSKTQAVDYGFEEPESANLFVERWKLENLDAPPTFPLDRLAFLNAIHHHCSRKHFFFLRNSQLKQLSKREVRRRLWYDECHPRRLLTDLFAVYIHRRALFFRSRNVTCVGKSQFTKTYLGDNGLMETEYYYDRTVLYGPRETWEKKEESEDNMEDMSMTDLAKPYRDAAGKVEEGYFRKLSNAVAGAMAGIRKKNSPASEEESQ